VKHGVKRIPLRMPSMSTSPLAWRRLSLLDTIPQEDHTINEIKYVDSKNTLMMTKLVIIFLGSTKLSFLLQKYQMSHDSFHKVVKLIENHPIFHKRLNITKKKKGRKQ
jgi:hypothetical protein